MFQLINALGKLTTELSEENKIFKKKQNTTLKILRRKNHQNKNINLKKISLYFAKI